MVVNKKIVGYFLYNVFSCLALVLLPLVLHHAQEISASYYTPIYMMSSLASYIIIGVVLAGDSFFYRYFERKSLIIPKVIFVLFSALGYFVLWHFSYGTYKATGLLIEFGYQAVSLFFLRNSPKESVAK